MGGRGPWPPQWVARADPDGACGSVEKLTPAPSCPLAEKLPVWGKRSTTEGRVNAEEPAMKCEICNANVNELRRGRCWGCYNRWVDARPVGLGAQCCVCGERRRDQLRAIELLGSWMPMCYSCSGQAMPLEPLPQTLAGIRSALTRERRQDVRRGVKKDTRVFQYDRRHEDRRRGRAARELDWLLIDDELVIEIDETSGADKAKPAEDDELTHILDSLRIEG